MKKVSIELVQEVMVDLDVAPITRSAIMRAIQQAAEKLAEDAEKEPKAKQQFVILLPDPNNIVTTPLPPGQYNLDQIAEHTAKCMAERIAAMSIGWVVQLPESDPPAVSVDRIVKAAYAFNVTKKGRKMPVKTFGEACEVVPAKLLKEQNVAVKTKLPVSVLVVENGLPKEAI